MTEYDIPPPLCYEHKKKPTKTGRLSGEKGIRTLGPLMRSTVFETAPFDHSGISPWSVKKKQLIVACLAEKEGFEPPVPFSTTVFKTAAIDHSAISPLQKYKNYHSHKHLNVFFPLFFLPKNKIYYNYLVKQIVVSWRKNIFFLS